LIVHAPPHQQKTPAIGQGFVKRPGLLADFLTWSASQPAQITTVMDVSPLAWEASMPYYWADDDGLRGNSWVWALHRRRRGA
jgi:hypothetical protein